MKRLKMQEGVCISLLNMHLNMLPCSCHDLLLISKRYGYMLYVSDLS